MCIKSKIWQNVDHTVVELAHLGDCEISKWFELFA